MIGLLFLHLLHLHADALGLFVKLLIAGETYRDDAKSHLQEAREHKIDGHEHRATRWV